MQSHGFAADFSRYSSRIGFENEVVRTVECQSPLPVQCSARAVQNEHCGVAIGGSVVIVGSAGRVLRPSGSFGTAA
jgi:hypothetical protein